MASYKSGSEDEMSRGGSPIPQNLFRDDSDDDGGGRGGRISEAEEDNSYNRREGGVTASGRDKNTDDEEEEREREKKKKKDEDKKKKPKGPVRRQMISEDMLIGKNGISTLPDLFKDFAFGGKGREKQDLDKILCKLEHWIHLLHPKQPFDQCLQRIEFLGGKRKVIKTHLKKIRMGMINNYEENDLVVDDDEELMNNIDATELAESAAAFVNQEELENRQLSSSSPPPPPDSTKPGNVNDEFPDDDDEFLETIGDEEVGNSNAVEEMDVDMDDVPPFDDDDDDLFQKQIEAQIKRAEQVDTASAQREQSKHSSGAEDNQPDPDSSSGSQHPPVPLQIDNTESFSINVPNEELEPIDNGNNGNNSGAVKLSSQDSTLENATSDGDLIERNNVERVVDIEGDDGINVDDIEDNDD